MTISEPTEPSQPSAAPVLRMTNISKSFPGVHAVNGMSLTVAPGEVHAIVGENGAGKSTLMKILAGVHAPDEGEIEIEGRHVRIRSQLDAQRLGIGMVYQELSLVPDLTVAENISLGRMPRRHGLVDRKEMRARARQALHAVGADIPENALVADLSVSQQQLVEIARVQASGARIVVLDEPTSSLTQHETDTLFRTIRQLAAKGVATLYISHRLREVLDIADRVTVIRDGVLVDTTDASSLTPESLVRMMVGRELAQEFPKISVPIGEPVLTVRGLVGAGRAGGVDLEVRRGEIVGLAGLVGSGRSSLARILAGLEPASKGEIRIAGAEARLTSPRRAVARSIGYVPEERRQDGIISGASVQRNLTLTVLPRLAAAGVVRRRHEVAVTESFISALSIFPPSRSIQIDYLSGGNQQKVVLAKALATSPQVLILDEPTRGVDVGAKAELHRMIGDLAAQGVAILMISSELPEILGVCDRIYVLNGGSIVEEFARTDATEEAIMAVATGTTG